MKEPELQPPAADVDAPSDIAGDDIGRRTTGPTEDDERRPRGDEPKRVSEASDAGTTRGGGAGGPEPPPV